LRLTIEEGVWSKHRRQIPALDTEQADKTERTPADLGIPDPDQGLAAIPGIAARQIGLVGDCRDIAADMRQTIRCVEIHCDRDGSYCRRRAAITV
jgi:hypothetical protein